MSMCVNFNNNYVEAENRNQPDVFGNDMIEGYDIADVLIRMFGIKPNQTAKFYGETLRLTPEFKENYRRLLYYINHRMMVDGTNETAKPADLDLTDASSKRLAEATDKFCEYIMSKDIVIKDSKDIDGHALTQVIYCFNDSQMFQHPESTLSFDN